MVIILKDKMGKGNRIQQRYERLNIERATFDTQSFPGSSHISIYGDTLYDKEREYGIQVIGRTLTGKTTTIEKMTEISQRFVRIPGGDPIIFNYQERLVIPRLSGLYPFELQRLIHFLKDGETGFDHKGLEKSLEFCLSELGILPTEFVRTENDISTTAKRLYNILIN